MGNFRKRLLRLVQARRPWNSNDDAIYRKEFTEPGHTVVLERLQRHRSSDRLRLAGPWFGAGKTTVRGGYQMTFNQGQVANSITQENVVPGSTLNGTYAGDSAANAYLDLTSLPLVPVIQIYKPLQPVPDGSDAADLQSAGESQESICGKCHAVGDAEHHQQPHARRSLHWDFGPEAVELQLPDQPAEFLVQRLERRLRCSALRQRRKSLSSGSGKHVQGHQHCRRWLRPCRHGVQRRSSDGGSPARASTATSPNISGGNLQHLANGNTPNVAAILNTMNYATASNPNLPVIPAGVNGAVLRTNGFPENFIVTNPQFSQVYVISEHQHEQLSLP